MQSSVAVGYWSEGSALLAQSTRKTVSLPLGIAVQCTQGNISTIVHMHLSLSVLGCVSPSLYRVVGARDCSAAEVLHGHSSLPVEPR